VKGPAPEALLPLKPASFHVLLAVAGGFEHGYAIRKEVERRTAGQVRLWPATLYGTIAELLKAGLLEEDAGRASDDDRSRRFYRLSGFGRKVLRAELSRLESLVAEGRQLVGESPAGRRA